MSTSLEEMIAWANNPPSWHTDSFASSEREAAEIRAFVIHERRQLLLDLAREELSRRAGIQAPSGAPSTNVMDADAQQVLTLEECLAWLPEIERIMPYTRRSLINQYWLQIAQRYAFLNGFSTSTTKYSDEWYKPQPYIGDAEAVFRRAYEYASKVANDGGTPRFLMRGAKHIRSAAMDVESAREALSRMYETAGNGMRPLAYWKYLLELADARSQVTTYEEQVKSLDSSGVYLAPYIHDAVVASPDFLDADDFARVSLLHGRTASLGYAAFKRIVLELLSGQTFYEVERRYLGTWQDARSGVLFVESGAVATYLETVDERRSTLGSHIGIAYAALQAYDLAAKEDTTYEAMIFGG